MVKHHRTEALLRPTRQVETSDAPMAVADAAGAQLAMSPTMIERPSVDADRADTALTGAVTDGEGRLWSHGCTWGLVAVAVASLVALTSQTSDHPIERVAIALTIVGGVLAVFGLRDRDWWFMPVALALFVGGGLLLADGRGNVEVVTAGGAALLLAGGAIAGRYTWRRLGATAAVVAAAIFGGAAWLLVVYDRELLALSLGVLGAVVAAVGLVGIQHRHRHHELERSASLRSVLVSGVEALLARASASNEVDLVREKVLFEGPTRAQRIYRFAVLMFLASAIASLGVIADSTAVVIGGMLVAPMLTPLMGVSLSLAGGEKSELGRAGLVASLGVIISVTVGFVTAAALGRGVDTTTNAEIAARVSPTLIDLAVAVAAGSAGAFALSRRDVSDALPGVAVAIALVPPLAVVGITAQLGAWDDAGGALLLFGTNALAVTAMGAAAFVVTGIARADDVSTRTFDWQTLWLGALTVAVVGALVVNTDSLNRAGADNKMAAGAVSVWIGDRDYDIIDVEVSDAQVVVQLSGPAEPDGVDRLAQSLDRVLDGIKTVDVQVALTESSTITVDDDG